MLLEGPLKDPMGLGWPQSREGHRRGAAAAASSRASGCITASSSPSSSALIVWVIMKTTTLGYEMRAVGHNPQAARFAGIPVNRVLMKTALLSGGLAGLAGFSEVAGLKGNLTLDLSPGFGYSASSSPCWPCSTRSAWSLSAHLRRRHLRRRRCDEPGSPACRATSPTSWWRPRCSPWSSRILLTRFRMRWR